MRSDEYEHVAQVADITPVVGDLCFEYDDGNGMWLCLKSPPFTSVYVRRVALWTEK